ncbi:glycosyltransferase [Calothrix membranacea FACHB-236]|nr:glycosyltransferase [Calothrix membranacea FACHB-236]
MDAKPLVSIIINNYNYARFLSDAIDSSLAQTYPYIEVIVVDDGSTDNSRDIIDGYDNQIVRVFKDNGGQASALNVGFAASQGEIICLLDADDIYLPEKVSEVVDLFKNYQNIDWVFHESVSLNSEDIIHYNFKNQDNLAQNTQKDIQKLVQEIDFRNNILNAELPKFVPATSNLCFSRKIVDKIFPLPEIKGFSGTAISDLYIKYLAIGLGTGYVSKKKLGIFRLHNNIYSNPEISINKKRKMYAEINMITAYWMRVKFPAFSKLSKKLFCKGLANYLRIQGSEYEEVIKDYLSTVGFIEKIEITWKTFYYFIKLGFATMV